MKIAIIGTGNLGSSIAKGLITNNAITTLYLTKRNVSGLADFEGYKNVFLTADNSEAIQKSDIIILAVQPAHLEKILIDALFNRLGTTISIPEQQMQAATVVCASGIAFWMRLIRATTQAAIQLGFDAEEAQNLAMFTCEGAASLLITSGNHPEQEIDRVTTPNGCTIEGLNEMEHKGLSSSLIQGMVASFDKINSIKTQ
jgi:pyrroline-5-carboxylate reductase